MFAWGFAAQAYDIKTASSRSDVQLLIQREPFHAACVDWKMQEGDPAEIVALLRERLPDLPLIALVAENQRKLSGELNAEGVAACLISPFPIEKLHALVRTHALTDAVIAPIIPDRAVSLRASSDALARFLVHDDLARRTVELAVRAANSNATILILGETGTGKSLLARAVHQHSPIRERPFVTVNCPCLGRELLESELFGHVRGAFTGAVQDTPGKVAAAEGGTLFLDEIGELPMALQPKLLRLLQEKQYERVGEASSRTADVRIIAATNRDLKREVDAGRFREDLYYRLNVIEIDVPALRGRPAQITGAAEALLETVAAQLGRKGATFGVGARRMLEAHAWPGNLRELRNVIERAVILSSGPVLREEDFPALNSPAVSVPYQIGGAVSLAAVENAHIQLVVANSASLDEAARILEIDKSTLYRKRKQMESRVARFVTPPHPMPVRAMATGA